MGEKGSSGSRAAASDNPEGNLDRAFLVNVDDVYHGSLRAAVESSPALSPALRPDGSPQGVAERRAAARREIRCMKRLQDAFAAAGTHPFDLLGRFVPPGFSLADGPAAALARQAEHVAKSIEAGGRVTGGVGGELVPLDLVALQWLLRGIGYTLTGEDAHVLAAHFQLDLEGAAAKARASVDGLGGGAAKLTKRGEGAAFRFGRRSTAAATMAPHRETKETPEAREGRRSFVGRAARQRAVRAAWLAPRQRQAVLLDAALLLVRLDTAPSSCRPALTPRGIALFEGPPPRKPCGRGAQSARAR
jgi:hypothetical protein